MLNDLTECDKASPPIKHLRLQVFVCTIPVLDSGDTLGEKLVASFLCIYSNSIDLIVSESFICHQLAQVVYLELIFEDLLSDRSNLININRSLGICGLFLPSIESVAHISRYEMSKHGLLLPLNNMIAKNLPSQVTVMLQKKAPTNLG